MRASLTESWLRVSSNRRLWWWLSMASATCYAGMVLRQAWSTPDIVPLDARVHVFWMQRFIDPSLFPHDLIADYAQSISPPGFAALYRVLTAVGLRPLVTVRLLPFVIGLVSTAFLFQISLDLFSVPLAAFLACELFNQALWAHQDVASATARALLYPLFLWFFLCYIRRRLWTSTLAAALLSACYPPMGAAAAGLLVADVLRQPPSGRSRFRFAAAGVIVGLLVLAPQGLRRSPYGPVLSAAEGRQMPELGPDGDYAFFTSHPLTDKIWGDRAGLLPLFEPPLALFGLVLPFFAIGWFRAPGAARLSGEWRAVGLLVVVSVGLFVLAHLVLFRLYHPSRYTMHSFRIVLALSGGAATVLALDWVVTRSRAAIAVPTLLVVVALLASYPLVLDRFGFGFPNTGYIKGRSPDLYAFLRRQPADVMIAGTSSEMDNIPTFAARSVLVGRAFGLPWHVGYYRQMRERTIDVLRAQYAMEPGVLSDAIRKYHIDLWVLDRDAFEYWYPDSNRWLRQYSVVTSQAVATLKSGGVPVLERLAPACEAFHGVFQRVVRGECVLAETMRSASVR